jgi:RimJ/RimL family protein N-acetyltransferase
MNPSHAEQVAKLSVSDAQKPFVGTIDEILCNVSPSVRPHVIMDNGHVVGFFLLDNHYEQCVDFLEYESLGLRAYFVDQTHQGKGYGKRAITLLRPYLLAHYPQFKAIYLTVNCKNPAAIHCYKHAGFEDTQSIFLGGDAGPQHIFMQNLAAH